MHGWSLTFAAMTRFPAAFDGVRCLVSPQPITPRYIAERRLAVIGLGDRLDDFNILLRLRTSIGLSGGFPQEWAKNVREPTFLYQVCGDTLTNPRDDQTSTQHSRDRQEAPVDRGHDRPLGRLPGVPASS